MFDHHLTECTANRAYLVQTITAHIAAIGFVANITLGACEALDGHYAGLLARAGVAAVTASVWFASTYRANLMRARSTEGRPLEILRQPLLWLPSFAFEQARIGDARVQLLPPAQR